MGQSQSQLHSLSVPRPWAIPSTVCHPPMGSLPVHMCYTFWVIVAHSRDDIGEYRWGHDRADCHASSKETGVKVGARHNRATFSAAGPSVSGR